MATWAQILSKLNVSSANGILTFDGLAINADNTKFNVGQIKAWFDDASDPTNPLKVEKIFAAQTAISVTNLF